MTGMPVTRAHGPGGVWAYTLYQKPGGLPFVHALDTARRQAYCIDLPLDLRRAAQMELRLRLRAGGRELVVRRVGAAVAVMDTKTFLVRGERS